MSIHSPLFKEPAVPTSAIPPPAAPPVRQSDRRDRLVDAAERAFARRGFHAATVPEIAGAAGVSVGLLYRYFAGKSALAVAIVERDRAQTLVAIRDLVAAVPEPWAALTHLVEGWIAVALGDRAACALVAEIGAEATRDPAVGRVVTAADAEITGLVAGLLSAACPGLDAAATAVVVLGALDGIVGRIAYDPGFDPAPAAAALLAAFAPHRRLVHDL